MSDSFHSDQAVAEATKTLPRTSGFPNSTLRSPQVKFTGLPRSSYRNGRLLRLATRCRCASKMRSLLMKKEHRSDARSIWSRKNACKDTQMIGLCFAMKGAICGRISNSAPSASILMKNGPSNPSDATNSSSRTVRAIRGPVPFCHLSLFFGRNAKSKSGISSTSSP